MTDPKAWPTGCLHPNSCSRHGSCMYANCAHQDRDITAEIEAALSGTREAGEPVALTEAQQKLLSYIEERGGAVQRKHLNGAQVAVAWRLVDLGKLATDGASTASRGPYNQASQDTLTFVTIDAAPPSDPVGQGAVTVARSDVEFLLQMAEQHPGVTAKRVAKSVRAALSPAPEAGSDEVERLRVRAKKSWNDLQLVWDGILGDRPRCRDCADEDGVCPHSKLPCDPTEAAVAKALIWKNEATALRDQLGKMREALDALLDAETVSVHVGYDNGPGGGNFLYADAIRTDDPAFLLARATLAETQEAGR